ncbi:MAG: hypothetical protein KAJ12_03410, partial [Bacteroidetes bacterium]|nr:hypothetical protein [Bacteroidota bacterium]
NRDTETFTRYRHDPDNPHSLASDVVRCVLEDSRGTIWIGTKGGGLDRVDPIMSTGRGQAKERFIHYTHHPSSSNSLSSNSILSLFEDKSGKIWIGTSDEGLNEFDRESGIFVRYKHDREDPNSLSSNWVNAIYEDNSGTLWVGVGAGGLNKLDRATGTFTHYSHDTKNPKSLSYWSAHSIHEDRTGTLWVGTAAGLNRFDRSTETFTYFTVRDGIASDFIGGILEDESGCLWLKTGKGVSKFNPRTGKFKNYDGRDGADIKPTWGKASYMTRNGEMFFGGINGFIRFYPDSIKDNPYVPPIVITAFKKFDEPVALDTVISEKKAIELSYKDNVFSFEFVALNYTSPEKNQYAYMLEGFDRDWVYCGTRRYASYTNLDGGTYIFKVKGSNNDGVWNEAGTSIAVFITPPFWKTWWFRGIILAIVAAFVAGFYRYRLSKIQGMERLRLRIADDLHDDIGSELGGIALESDLLARRIPGTPPDQARQQAVGTMIRQAAGNLRDVVWIVNPEQDKLQDLLTRMRDVASKMLTGIDYEFKSTGIRGTVVLDMEFKRHVLMMFKEIVNNIVKHAEATSVDINLELDQEHLRICVKDNGRGFDPAVDTDGRGMKTLESRASTIGGQLTIESKQGSGTVVCVEARIARL